MAPGDPNYATVQSRLQTYARSLVPGASLNGCDTWNWGYIGIFLSEYYLRTVADGAPDTQCCRGSTPTPSRLAKGQSKYGTFGHKGAEQLADGSLHGSISWYGPVNAAGMPANIGIVIGKKALLAAGQAIDPEIDPAIERADNFFGWYINKGSIPYGEHEPYADNHASNGKDAMCAVLFGLQDSRPTETEYFSRMTTAGCTGREYGHTGQGFSYLWGALGTNVGGPAAVTAYLNNIRWHLDLERRTDGSFVYDGGEQYGAGTTPMAPIWVERVVWRHEPHGLVRPHLLAAAAADLSHRPRRQPRQHPRRHQGGQGHCLRDLQTGLHRRRQFPGFPPDDGSRRLRSGGSLRRRQGTGRRTLTGRR